jgi:DNA-binding transcriptional ArsR family regulator
VAGGVGPVFDALGDPGRRELMQAVAERGSATATELAAERDVTRQAVSKQLGTLAAAGLLRARRQGRETRYEVAAEPLADALAWLTEVGAAWDERLGALRTHLGRRRR